MTEACSTTTASSKAVMSGSIDTAPTFHLNDSGLRGEHIFGPMRWET